MATPVCETESTIYTDIVQVSEADRCGHHVSRSHRREMILQWIRSHLLQGSTSHDPAALADTSGLAVYARDRDSTICDSFHFPVTPPPHPLQSFSFTELARGSCCCWCTVLLLCYAMHLPIYLPLHYTGTNLSLTDSGVLISKTYLDKCLGPDSSEYRIKGKLLKNRSECITVREWNSTFL